MISNDERDERLERVPENYESRFDIYAFIEYVLSKTKYLLFAFLLVILLSAGVVKTVPNPFYVNSIIGKTSELDVTRLNSTISADYKAQELARRFYDLLRAKKNFSNFLEKVNNNEVQISDIGYLSERLQGNLKVTILEPRVEFEWQQPDYPDLIEVGLLGADERLLVELLNNYVLYTERKLFDNIIAEVRNNNSIRILELERRITKQRSLLIENRKLDVEKISNELNELLSSLQRERELTLKYGMLSHEAQKFEELKIANDALKVAKELGLDKPTPLLEISQFRTAEETFIATSLNDIPLYLLGTKYLETYIKNLNADDSQPLKVSDKLIVIDQKIEETQKKLEQAVNIIDRPVDPYIPNIKNFEAEIAALRAINYDDANASMVFVVQEAYESLNYVTKNKGLIVAFGFFLISFLFILMITLIAFGFRCRAQQIL